MLNASEECTCRAMDVRKDSSRRALVVVAPGGALREVRNIVAASLPTGSSCTGSVWQDPEGRTVEVLGYEDQVPSYNVPYDLEICNAGTPLTLEELGNAKRWRDGSRQ